MIQLELDTNYHYELPSTPCHQIQLLNPRGLRPHLLFQNGHPGCNPLAHQDMHHPYPDTQCMVSLPTKPGSFGGKSR